jgi:hypothetical protein
LLTADPTKAATPGCQTIPDDAKLELVERSPSVFTFLRMIKVKVKSQKRPDLTSGFTIEIGREFLKRNRRKPLSRCRRQQFLRFERECV